MNGTLPERIFICGFMGTGKSTVGKALANRLERPFYDLDACIENHTQKTIPQLFDIEGEAGFRQKEQAALLSIIRTKKGVIALGGGTLQNQHIVDHVKVNGLLVFIDTPLAVILDRIMEYDHRPLLMNEQGKMRSRGELNKTLGQLLKQRLHFYNQAEVTVDTADHPSNKSIVTELMKKIRYHVALH